VVAVGLYVVLSLVHNLPAWLHGASSHVVSSGRGDVGQEVWYFAWTAHAITHLQNPLVSGWVSVPQGYNLASATSMPLAGLVGLPITLAFGPVATYNVLSSLALAGAATSAFFVARRWVRWTPAAFFAGLLFGFGPFMVGQSLGHLFVTLAFPIPLLLLVFDEILVRQRWAWWRAGVALGALVIIELGLSLELLTDALVLAALGAVALCIARRDEVSRRLGYALRATVLAVVVAAPAIGWYLWTFLDGAWHKTGAIHPVAALEDLSVSLAGVVVPSHNQVITLGAGDWSSHLVHVWTSGAILAEDGSYLGIPLLALVIGGLVLLWRREAMRFFGLLAAGSLLFSMGARLRIAGVRTPIPLPFAIFARLPFFNDTIAIRWTLFTMLFAGLMAAMCLDGLRREATAPSGTRRARRRFAVALGLAVLSVVTLLPPWPQARSGAVEVPAWFSTGAAARIKAGSTVLVYPDVIKGSSLTMLDQAVGGMRWRIVGGETGVAEETTPALIDALEDCYENPTLTAPPASLLPGARAELAAWDVSTAVAVEGAPNLRCVVGFLTQATGRPPMLSGGVAVWTNLR
jgi:hypothetical protein